MGKRRISICLGSSCFARGNNANIAVVKQFLADRGLEAEVTFTGQLCENMCNRGPIICIDDQVYEEVNLSLLHKILEEEFKCYGPYIQNRKTARIATNASGSAQ